jgi:hypothetical protein
MELTDTMRWMGRSARNRAEAVGHQVKDRSLGMRLERATEDNERLRTENRTLKQTVEEARADHERILTLLEQHRDETGPEPEDDEGSHKGRWFMFLMLLAGGAWAWMKSRGADATGWPAGSPASERATLGGAT